MKPHKILTRSEFQAVVEHLQPLARRSPNTHQNLILFRLSACCGLRVSEIVALTLSDVRTGRERPHVVVRHGKGDKHRVVPLNWDAATLHDLAEWKILRQQDGAKQSSPFLCCLSKSSTGRPLSVENAQHRWRTAIACLGAERQAELSIHCGRHTFCSHALHNGKSAVQVRDAAGHSSISTTNVYLHLMDDDDKVGDLFDYREFSKPALKVFA